MAKKQSASSQRAKPIAKSAESIWNKPLTKAQRAVVQEIAARQAGGDDTTIDYSEIPALTEEQLAEFKMNRQR